ncbi:MAG: peptidoglycan-binding domain-containing protein [Ghiorsea sp.]
MARPLKVFMRGKSVTILQEALRIRGYTIADQRALFGMDTREAVKSFQKQQGLKATGLVDDELLKLIQQGQAPTAKVEKVVKKVEVSGVNQEQLDALVNLLVRKGVIEEGELESEIKRVIPKSLS